MIKIINIIILLILIYIFIYCDNIYTLNENFNNIIENYTPADAIQFSSDIKNLMTKAEWPNGATVSGDFVVKGLGTIKNFVVQDNTILNGNTIINGNAKINNSLSIGNSYINNGILNIDKIVLGGKYVLYTNQDAFAIGKLADNGKIIPGIYLNPGSREGMWIIEAINNNQIYYYWFNSGSSGHSGRPYDSNSLNNILKNTNYRNFIGLDNL
jgi:hypothetical protein